MMSGTVTALPASSTPFSMRAILAPLVAITIGAFMALLDNTVVTVAVPKLEHVFRTDLHVIQWVITAYMLAEAAVIPLSGWLSDRFGARRLFVLSLALFTAGSLLCAVAQSGPMLIGFRILQGLGGGMLLPLGMAFLYRLAPPERRGAVMGAYGIPVLIAPALGPILSGWLVQYADWRYIFLLNVPIGVGAIVLGLRALPTLAAPQAPGALDVLGVVLAPVGFAAVSYGINESTTAGWSGATTLAGLGVGAAALLAFAIRELTTPQPLLELRVFRSLDFSLAIVTLWVGNIALFGVLILVPLFLQQVRGYGAFDTGLYLLPQAIAAGLGMLIGGSLFDRIGARPLALAGLALITGSGWVLGHVTGTTTGADLRWVLAIRGAGMGLMMMPLMTHVLSAAPRALVSRVTSLNSALLSLVGSLGIATLATILQNRAAAHLATARMAVAAYTRAAGRRAAMTAHQAHAATTVSPSTGRSGAVAPPHDVVLALQHYATNALHAALATAFDDTFMVATAVGVAGIVLALTLRGVPSGDPQPMVIAAGETLPESSAHGAVEAAIG
jgi:EmrB/QacA subfamily drug resistance transporter